MYNIPQLGALNMRDDRDLDYIREKALDKLGDMNLNQMDSIVSFPSDDSYLSVEVFSKGPKSKTYSYLGKQRKEKLGDAAQDASLYEVYKDGDTYFSFPRSSSERNAEHLKSKKSFSSWTSNQ